MGATFLAIYVMVFLWGGACADPAEPDWRPANGYLSVSYDSSIPFVYQKAISKAVATWAEHLQVDTVFTASPQERGALRFRMVKGDHGDGFPFTPNGPRISHVVSTPGDRSWPEIHFNAAVEWKTDGGDPDIYVVALHEIGHALGLHHSSDAASIMYPWYGRGRRILDSELPAAFGFARSLELNSRSVREKNCPILPF